MTQKVTQYEQVIEALRKFGRWATPAEICKKIDFKHWEADSPENSVSMYLTSYENKKYKKNPIKRKKINNKFHYKFDVSAVPSRKNVGNIKNTNDNKPSPKENVLYLICLNTAFVKFPAAENLFKIGRTEDLIKRMDSYRHSLPFEPIQQVTVFPVPVKLDILEIEKNLREKLLHSNLGITEYGGGKQKEWLQMQGLNIEDRHQREQLVSEVKGIFKEIIRKP